MTDTNNLIPPLAPASMAKPMLIGAAIGFTLIAFFLLNAGEPNPEWHKLWRMRPLIIVPLAGAAGGAFFYLMGGLRSRGGWVSVAAWFFSCIGFVVALWLGSVVGLDGTYWN